MIAVLIGYAAVTRFFAPVPIHFTEAIPIACLGLAVNVASAWILSSGDHHHHGHGHSQERGDDHDHDEGQRITTPGGVAVLEIFEAGVPPRFRLRAETGPALDAMETAIETVRHDGTCQQFTMANRGEYLESIEEIPEPPRGGGV